VDPSAMQLPNRIAPPLGEVGGGGLIESLPGRVMSAQLSSSMAREPPP
jgi:hypothetical protein